MDDDAVEFQRLKALRARRAKGMGRLEDHLIPGLPVDADAMELRHPIPRIDSLLDAALASLEHEANPFFDAVCEQWPKLFPAIPAKPDRFADGVLYFQVASSSVSFAVRQQLNVIKRKLAALPEAPKRFAVRLELCK